VLHVIPFDPFAVPGFGAIPDPAVPDQITGEHRAQATRSLAELVAPFLGDGVTIETKLLGGEPWRAIVAEAEDLPAGLLVIGTHGRGGFERLLLGSVTEKVMRRAPCPVLTMGRASAQPLTSPLFHSVLCATDLMQASKRTLDVALSLAAENDAQITLLHAIESLPDGPPTGLYRALPEIGALRSEIVAQTRGQLQRAVPEAARGYCKVSERVEIGTAWDVTLRVADEVEADLIVMGAHTGSAVGRMLFGSTTNQVIRRARCPVLVTRETHAKRFAAEGAPAARAR
jgi:nucleotide-binding universal stress UspA family protein